MGSMENASIAALASDFSDTSSALKQLSLAAYAPVSQPNRIRFATFFNSKLSNSKLSILSVTMTNMS